MRITRVVLLIIALATSAAAQGSKRLDDNSDWWSLLKDDKLGEGVSPKKKEPAANHFRIAGLTLGVDPPEVYKKFGRAVRVDRGDAATGRQQICYVSPSGDLHLIFEWGEVESVFYLLQGGTKWEGSQYCAESKAVSRQVSTVSGLKLGLSPEQVAAILGKPNTAAPDRLFYSFEFAIHPSPEGLRKLRAENPQLTDAEFQSNFARFDVTVFIETRFTKRKLNYLTISRSETY